MFMIMSLYLSPSMIRDAIGVGQSLITSVGSCFWTFPVTTSQKGIFSMLWAALQESCSLRQMRDTKLGCLLGQESRMSKKSLIS